MSCVYASNLERQSKPFLSPTNSLLQSNLPLCAINYALSTNKQKPIPCVQYRVAKARGSANCCQARSRLATAVERTSQSWLWSLIPSLANRLRAVKEIEERSSWALEAWHDGSSGGSLSISLRLNLGLSLAVCDWLRLGLQSSWDGYGVHCTSLSRGSLSDSNCQDWDGSQDHGGGGELANSFLSVCTSISGSLRLNRDLAKSCLITTSTEGGLTTSAKVRWRNTAPSC